MSSRLILFIFVLFAVISLGMFQYTERAQDRALKDSALHTARLYSEALSAFRSLYASEVVPVAEAHSIEVTHDYHARDALPLPATLSMLLGKEIGKAGSGVESRLYSPYPFPWRKKEGGLPEEFQQKAWLSLKKNPEEPYFEFVDQGGRGSLRYAVADIMRASCIGCHNTHPDSPKTDWETGDLRGILEVSFPVESHVFPVEGGYRAMIFAYALLSVGAIIGVALVVSRQSKEAVSLQRANKQLEAALREIKTLRGIIPICSYCHNIRDDEGAWGALAKYVGRHSEVEFSHGICPECLEKTEGKEKRDAD